MTFAGWSFSLDLFEHGMLRDKFGLGGLFCIGWQQTVIYSSRCCRGVIFRVMYANIIFAMQNNLPHPLGAVASVS